MLISEGLFAWDLPTGIVKTHEIPWLDGVDLLPDVSDVLIDVLALARIRMDPIRSLLLDTDLFALHLHLVDGCVK